VVLAVIPANVDIATVDILERAAKVDPGGTRTMGVLTKPDLVDKGAESCVLSVLANRAKPLQHGYVMLKNRSQEDLDGKMTIDQARKAEQDWFAASKYAGDSNRLGVGALTEALTELLVSQIYAALPEIRQEINTRLEAAQNEILNLGTAPPDTPGARRANAAEIVRTWAASMRKVARKADYSELAVDDGKRRLVLYERQVRKEFAAEVEATRPGFDGEKDRLDVEVTEEGEGFESKVGDVLEKQSWINPRSVTKIGETIASTMEKKYKEGKIIRVAPYFRGDLAARIEVSRGRELPGFMNFGVFTELVCEYVERWTEPANKFRESMLKAATDAAILFIETSAAHAPRLAARLKALAVHELDTANSEAEARLDKLIQGERAPSTENHYLWDTINKIRNERITTQINSMPSDYGHDGFVGKEAVIAMLKSSIGNDSNESQELQDMIDLLSAYWKLAVKRYIDEVGMAITDVFTSDERILGIERTLSDAVVMMEDTDLQRLFKQSASQEQRRAELTSAVARLRTAKQRIEEDDIAAWSLPPPPSSSPKESSWVSSGFDKRTDEDGLESKG
jgi:hypothetical protein